MAPTAQLLLSAFNDNVVFWMGVGVALSILLFTVIVFQRKCGLSRQDIRVTGLVFYPIKSCAGVRTTTAELDRLGIKLDRRWMVTKHDGTFLTGREHPNLVVLQPSFEVSDDKLMLHLKAPGMNTLVLPAAPPEDAQREVSTKVWESDFRCVLYEDDESKKWLKEYLGADCRLAALLPLDTHDRPIEEQFNSGPLKANDDVQIGFADGFPFLIISEESVDDVHTRCSAPEDVSSRNFRGNIIVGGVNGPYAEDLWKRIRIGNVELVCSKPCARCVMTTVSPDTGRFNKSREPLKFLKRFRRWPRDKKGFWEKDCGYFGVNATHLLPYGTLQVGDKVQVLEYH